MPRRTSATRTSFPCPFSEDAVQKWTSTTRVSMPCTSSEDFIVHKQNFAGKKGHRICPSVEDFAQSGFIKQRHVQHFSWNESSSQKSNAKRKPSAFIQTMTWNDIEEGREIKSIYLLAVEDFGGCWVFLVNATNAAVDWWSRELNTKNNEHLRCHYIVHFICSNSGALDLWHHQMSIQNEVTRNLVGGCQNWSRWSGPQNLDQIWIKSGLRLDRFLKNGCQNYYGM